jgi:hypothetical protein
MQRKTTHDFCRTRLGSFTLQSLSPSPFLVVWALVVASSTSCSWYGMGWYSDGMCVDGHVAVVDVIVWSYSAFVRQIQGSSISIVVISMIRCEC